MGQSSADHSSVSILYQGLQSVPFSWTGLPEVVALFPHAPIIVIRESDSSSTDCQKVADTEKTFFHLQHTNVCQSNTACNNLSQSQCSNNMTCTRQPSSSNSKPQCIRQDGQPATDIDCKPNWTKPSCGSTLPTLSLPSDITIDTKLLPNNSPRNKCHESRHYAVTVNNPSRKKMKISTKTTITNGYGGTIYDQQDYNNSNISTTSHQFIVKTGYSGDV
ncbi:MAG: hypothetical protein Q4B28_04500 [bacterium]|nr:hypothetical protein [bacterium]